MMFHPWAGIYESLPFAYILVGQTILFDRNSANLFGRWKGTLMNPYSHPAPGRTGDGL